MSILDKMLDDQMATLMIRTYEAFTTALAYPDMLSDETLSALRAKIEREKSRYGKHTPEWRMYAAYADFLKHTEDGKLDPAEVEHREMIAHAERRGAKILEAAGGRGWIVLDQPDSLMWNAFYDHKWQAAKAYLDHHKITV